MVDVISMEDTLFGEVISMVDPSFGEVISYDRPGSRVDSASKILGKKGGPPPNKEKSFGKCPPICFLSGIIRFILALMFATKTNKPQNMDILLNHRHFTTMTNI